MGRGEALLREAPAFIALLDAMRAVANYTDHRARCPDASMRNMLRETSDLRRSMLLNREIELPRRRLGEGSRRRPVLSCNNRATRSDITRRCSISRDVPR